MNDISQLSLEEAQAKILAGETLTVEQYKSIIERYRGERRSAAATSKKSKASKLPADFDLNADLDALFAQQGKGQ